MATAHALAVALDEYLALTHGPTLVPAVAIMRTPAEAFAITDEDFAFYHLRDGNVPPAVRALARLRLEAACEVERLLRLLDALDAMDGDPDLEPCDEDCGHEETLGFEPNFATTAHEDATGVYADQGVGLWYGSQTEECEPVSEDEGAQCDDEGERDDNGIADSSGACEQGWGRNGMVSAVI